MLQAYSLRKRSPSIQSQEKEFLVITAPKILNKVMMWMKASFASLLLVALLHSTIAAPSCPDGSIPVNCFRNPCQFATCSAIPAATCEADFCGGCNAKWFFNGQEVTSLCQGGFSSLVPLEPQCSIPGQVYMKCGSACPPSCAVPHPFCIKICVPGCQCPTGTVLSGDRCISPENCNSD